MIHAALSHLTSRLNEFLARGLGISEDIVVLSQLADSDGSSPPGIANKLVLLLAGIEREHAAGMGSATNAGGAWTASRPLPLHLNLHVMLAANFSGANYPEALKMISAAILFFQKNPVFDRQSSPTLDARIDKLILDIEHMGRQDLANLWGVLGGRYLPSVLYRVRMVTFDSQDIAALTPNILGTDRKMHP